VVREESVADTPEEVAEVPEAEGGTLDDLDLVHHALDDGAGDLVRGVCDDLVGEVVLPDGEIDEFGDAGALGHAEPLEPLPAHARLVGEQVQGPQLLEHEHDGVDVAVHPHEPPQQQLPVELPLVRGPGRVPPGGPQQPVVRPLEQQVPLVVAIPAVLPGDPQAHLVHHLARVVLGHVEPVAHDGHVRQVPGEVGRVGVVLVHGHARDVVVELLGVHREERGYRRLVASQAGVQHPPVVEVDRQRRVPVPLEDGELVHRDRPHIRRLGLQGERLPEVPVVDPPGKVLPHAQPPGGAPDVRVRGVHVLAHLPGQVHRHMPAAKAERDVLGEGEVALEAPAPAVRHMPECPRVRGDGHRLQRPPRHRFGVHHRSPAALGAPQLPAGIEVQVQVQPGGLLAAQDKRFTRKGNTDSLEVQLHGTVSLFL